VSYLYIGPAERVILLEAARLARAEPIPWSVIKPLVPPNQDSDRLALEDRLPGSRPPPQHVELPGGWGVSMSVEEQPAGWLFHFSMSSPKLTPPHPAACQMVLQELGLDYRNAARVWNEEFTIDGKRAGWAVNMLFMERERTEAGGIN
jgi:hypothetical protein